MEIVLYTNLIYMSIASAGLIALMVLLRTCFLGRIPKICLVAAWVEVLFCLLLPMRVMITVDQGSWFAVLIQWIQSLQTGRLFVIWAVGTVIAAIFFSYRYFSYGKVLREAIPIQAVPNLDEEMFTFMGIRVYVSDRIASPITYGVVKQKVILPKYYFLLSREQLKYILIHEKVHISRRDNLKKMLVIVAVCIHWFNPFVWAMYYFYNRDMELACDESVIRQVGQNKRKEYASALISLAEQEYKSVPLYSAFGKSAIRERISMIIKSRGVSVLTGIICLTFLLPSVVAFTVPEKKTVSPAMNQGTFLKKPAYSMICDVSKVLAIDEYKTKASVIVRNNQGVDICFRLWLRRNFAATHGKIMSDFLPAGSAWQPGIDPNFDGDVVIPDAVRFEGKIYPVTSIGAYSFYKCSKVKNIVIPEGVTEIKEKAFVGCKSLTELKLPSSLQLVEINPFMGCTSLKRFQVEKGGAGQYRSRKGILYTDYGRFVKVYPQGRKNKRVTLPKDVTRIANRAFFGTQVEEVILPDRVYHVKGRAFEKCLKLEKVEAPRQTVFVKGALRGSPNAYIIRRK